MSFTMPAQNTSNITEGTNLYFTNARARSAISATGSLSYNSTTGVMSFTMPAQNTSNITEGTNLYYTNARADARIAAASTSDLSEGTNLYYTDARADARVALIVDSAPGTLNTLNELAAALGDDANFSTTVTNSIATKLPLAGGALTGAVTTNSTFDGRNVSVDGAKLDGIEAGATADQTAAEILTAIKTVDGSGSGLDADLLDGMNSSSSVVANTIVARQSNGYIYANHINFSTSESENPTINSFFTSNGDGWSRKSTKAHVISQLGLYTTSNDGSGSGLDADLLDGQNGSYYATASGLTSTTTTANAALPKAGGTMTGNLNLSGSGNYVLIGGTATNNAYNSVSSSTGLTFGGGNDFNNYSIGTSMQNIDGNYTKLNIKWHTGIRFFAMNRYGGVRFHSDVGMGTELMSIGNTDGHVRVANNLYANGGNLVFNVSNDGSGSGLDADLLDGQQGSYYYPASNPNGYTTNTGTLTATNDRIYITDTRSASRAPSYYDDRYVQADFTQSTNLGVSGGDTWSAVLTVSPWSVYDGSHRQQQLVFAGTNLYRRTASSDSAWGSTYKLWDSGNDGSGSGLDADLLDGNQASAFLTTSGKAADSNLLDGIDSTYFNRGTNAYGVFPGSSGHNLNDVFTGSSYNRAGFIDAWSGSNFPPGTSHIQGIQVRHNSGTHYGWQLFGQYNQQGKLFHRQVSNGSWGSWSELWNSNNDGSGSGLDADLLDGVHGTSFLRSDADDAFTGNLTTGANNHITFGPNSSWGSSLRIGGNGRTATGTEMASIATTDGNIHLDAASSTNGIYLNYYAGTNGTYFGSGTGAIVAKMFADGQLYKSGTTANPYWNSTNDGSGSGLDADLLDGQQGSYYLPVSSTVNGYARAQGRVVTNVNDAAYRIPGMYGFNNVPTNGPGTNYSAMIVAANSDVGLQIVGGYTNNQLYFRGWHSSGGTYLGWNKVWHSTNDGSGSGLDADLLDGSQLHTGRNNEANKVVRTDANGYLQTGWINTTSGDSGLVNDVARIYCSSDSYVRYLGKSDFKVLMGLSKDTYDRRDYTSNTVYHTGANSHNDTSFDGLLQRGCGFIDNWNGGAGKPPTGTHWNGFQALHYGNGSSYFHGMQMAMAAGNPSNTFLRGWWANGGSGYGWQKIWTDGNDGSGSVLDADLLDGVHGTSFLRSDTADTFTGTLTMGTQQALVANNYGRGVFGLYSASRYQHVWSMGTAYKTSDDGTSYGNMYGLTWTHTNIGTGANQSIAGLSHQLQLRMNGTLYAAIGAGIWTLNTITSGAQGTLWGSSNDGSGSGLDADLLDGQHASAFQAAGSYLTAETVSSTNSVTITGAKYFQSNRNTTSNSPPLQVYSTGNTGAIMSFHRSGYYAVNMGLDSDNVFRIGGWSAAANRFVMDMSGNLTMAGNITAYSDSRLKENVEVIGNALSKVQAMRGVTFTRNDVDDKEERHAGVIAQEVEVVFPEVVSENNEGIKNVAYGNMVGLLIEAIKELKDEVDELKRQLKEK